MAHPKGVLIERYQRRGVQPTFDTRMHGPDHEPIFDTDVRVEGQVVASGRGSTKRAAERDAAEQALARLDAVDTKGAGPAAATARQGGRRRRGPGTSESGTSSPDGAAEGKGVAPPGGPVARRDAVPGTEAGSERDEPDAPFDGPWPMFETVLATCLRIAHDRVAAGLATDDAREGIERFATTLYKNVLSDLGELVDDD